MAVRIGINGFGRIGRVFMRSLQDTRSSRWSRSSDLTDTATLAHLFAYDSVHGAGGTVRRLFALIMKRRSKSSPPGPRRAAEGLGTWTRVDRKIHRPGGRRQTPLAGALSRDSRPRTRTSLSSGVNEGSYKPAEHHLVSNASCTTNCLAPVVKVLHDTFGVKRGQMTTIHSYTNDQKILDFPHKDLRRARAAALSMIPTSTGAAKAIGIVMPELKGKIDGFSMRVPTPNVSVVDFVAELVKPADEKAINAALKAAANGTMKGILDYTEEPLVSVDFCGSPASSTVDAGCTKVIDGTLAKVIAWYDNEMGYSCRLRDLIAFMAAKG
jgi:glyceraldehyde 3-phosphate dehydrogenase